MYIGKIRAENEEQQESVMIDDHARDRTALVEDVKLAQ
jgi:hypothetical protein